MTLRVIGAGFGRTGTASTKLALERLGFGPCYHMSEVFDKPERIGDWMAAIAGRPDWDKALAGYRSCVDFPACTWWRQLAQAYPQAKVLLTVRDAARWFDSINSTIMSPKMNEFIRGAEGMHPFFKGSIWDQFDGRVEDRDHMIACFNRHTEAVKAAIEPGRLLVFDVKQGWEPLCEFLGVAAPDEPFPRVNSQAETAEFIDQLIATATDGDMPTMTEEAERIFRPGGG